MSTHTPGTSPRLVNNPYPAQLNPGHTTEGTTQQASTDQRTTQPSVSQQSRPTPHFSMAIIGQQIVSGTTMTTGRAATTTTTTTNTTRTTTTMTTTTCPTYKNRCSPARDPAAGRPVSYKQILQLQNAGLSLLNDAIVRGDYEYALDLVDQGELPTNNFLPLQSGAGSRNRAISKLVFAGEQDSNKIDLHDIILGFTVQVTLQCPTQTQVINNGGADVHQVSTYGANALTMAITCGAPLEFINTLCEKAAKNDPEFVNRCDGAGRTALCMAAENGDLALIEVLMKAGAKLGAADWHGECAAVVKAARRNDTITLNKLFSYVSKELKDQKYLLNALNRLSSQSAILGLAQALHLKFPGLRGDLSQFTSLYLAGLPAESVARAFAEYGIICSDEQKFLWIANCQDPRSLAAPLDAVDEQFILKYIRQLRLACQPDPAIYDILVRRDPEFQALLTQSTFSNADLEELSRALDAARSAGATDWVERLIQMGAMPDMSHTPFHFVDDRSRILAYMADIDSANLSLWSEKELDAISDDSAYLLMTCTAQGLERLVDMMDKIGMDLHVNQPLLEHAVKLDSISVAQRILSTDKCRKDDTLATRAKSEEMRALLTQFNPRSWNGTAFESDSESESGSGSKPESSESDND